MKNFNKFLLIGVLLLTVDSAWAQRRRSTGTGSSSSGYGYGSSTPIETTMPESSSYSSSGGGDWAFGLASNYSLFRTTDTFFTGMYNISEKMAVQGFFYYHKDHNTNKNGLGGLFKYTVSGNSKLGLHVGGGLAFGKHGNDLSFMHILGNAGFHFPVHSRVLVNVDGGLTINNDDVSATQKDTGTSIEGHSGVWGVSILYIL